MPTVNTLAENVKPVALMLVEQGADITDAAQFAALFAIFMQQNTDAMAEAIASGENAEAVIAEALDCFRRDASAAWRTR
jgi:hypothetical protein